MQRIITPTHYVHTQHAAVDRDRPGLCAPPSDAGTRQGVYPSSLGDAGRSAISAMPMKPARAR